MPTRPEDTTERQMYDANDVMKLTHCKQNKAYELIRNLNKELSSQGFYTIRGRIPARYVVKRLGLNL